MSHPDHQSGSTGQESPVPAIPVASCGSPRVIYEAVTATPVQVPNHIVEAARTVQVWMEANSGEYWQLMGVCDRRFAYAIELIRAELEQNP